MSNSKVEIIHEGAPMNPYEAWDFLGRIMTWHPKYSMGEEVGGKDEALKTVQGEGGVLLRILMRGDDSITTKGGRMHVGYIHVSQSKLEDEGLADRDVEDIEETLAAEVKLYNNYHMGNCWGIKVYKRCECCNQPKSDEYESCWGYFGEDLEETGIIGYVHEVDPTVPVEDIEAAWEKRLDSI